MLTWSGGVRATLQGGAWTALSFPNNTSVCAPLGSPGPRCEAGGAEMGSPFSRRVN